MDLADWHGKDATDASRPLISDPADRPIDGNRDQHANHHTSGWVNRAVGENAIDAESE